MVVLIASCSSSKKALNTSSLNGEWNIIEVDGKHLSTNTQHAPFIGFNFVQKRIYGNSGCNRMMGTFNVDSLKPGVISFGPIAGTRMACPDMETEQAVLSALGKVKMFNVLAEDAQKADFYTKIALTDEHNKQLIVMTKREMTANTNPGLTDLAGEWAIKTVNGTPLAKTDKEPFIGFNIEEKRIYGNAACNSLNGPIKQEDGKTLSIKFGPIAATMMLCPDMEVERLVMEALDNVASFNILADGKLAFYNVDNAEIMTLERK